MVPSMLSETTFAWVLENFSLDDETYYSRLYHSRPFFVDGCNWRLIAYPRTYSNGDDYLSVSLELAPGSSPPPECMKHVKFTITLVNDHVYGKSDQVSGTKYFFHATNRSCGFSKFVPLCKLRDRYEGFLVDKRLYFTAQVHVLQNLPVKFLDFFAPPLGCKEINQASNASLSNSQVPQKTENASNENVVNDDTSDEGSHDDHDDETSDEGSDDDDHTSDEGSDDDDETSDEGSDDDDDTSDEGSDDGDDNTSEESSDDDDDDDASSTVSDDGGKDISPLNQSNPLEESSLATNDNGRNRSYLNQIINKSLRMDASHRVLYGDMGFNTVASTVTETGNNVLGQEIQTMDVNGFEVFPSQVESVRRIFERHPDITVEFRAKNQHLRKACMSFLLSVIETLCQSLEELSNEDLVEADIALTYLKDAGFKVDWLEEKLDQLKGNKEKEKSGLARLQEIEENLLKLKLKCSELDALAEKEKSELSVTRAALSFDDLV